MSSTPTSAPNLYLFERNLLLCHLLKQHRTRLKFPSDGHMSTVINRLLDKTSGGDGDGDFDVTNSFDSDALSVLESFSVQQLLDQISRANSSNNNNNNNNGNNNRTTSNGKSPSTTTTATWSIDLAKCITTSSTSPTLNKNHARPSLPPVPPSSSSASAPSQQHKSKTLPTVPLASQAPQQTQNDKLLYPSPTTTTTTSSSPSPTTTATAAATETKSTTKLPPVPSSSTTISKRSDEAKDKARQSLLDYSNNSHRAMDEWMKHVTDHVPLMDDPTRNYNLTFPMSEHDLALVSYESIILGSVAMTDLNQEDKMVGLRSIRRYCQVSDREHLDIVSFFTLDGAVSQLLSTTNDIEQQLKMIDASKKLFESERERIKLFMYRWLVVKSFRYSNRSNSNNSNSSSNNGGIQFCVRQITMFANVVMMHLMSLNQVLVRYRGSEIRKSDFEAMLKQLFNNLIQRFESEPSKVAPLVQEVDDTVHELLSQLRSENIDAIEIPEPFNIHLYSFLIGAKLSYIELLIEKSDDEASESDSDTDDEDIIDEDDPVNRLLSYARITLNVSDAADRLCFVNQLVESTHDSSYEECMHFEKQCIRELEYFYKYDERELGQSIESFKSFVLCRIFHIYGVKLCDIFDHYIEDVDLLKMHLKLYNTALRRWFKRTSFDSAQKSSMKAIVRLSTVRDFTRMKELKVQVPTIPKIELDGFEDMGDQIGGNPSDFAKLLEFADQLYNELETAIDSHFSVVDMYYANCAIEAIFTTIELYSNELITFVNAVGVLSPDVKPYFEKFENLIDLLACHTRDSMKVGSSTVTRYDISKRLIATVEPLSNAINPMVESFIRSAQERFTGYMDRSLQLEKWESMSDDNLHSASIVDLFTFLEQPTHDLFALSLPHMSHFYRAYAQCVSGLVQRYCDVIVKDVPAPQDLVPSLPKIPKSKNGIAKVLSNPNSVKKKQKAMLEAMAEQRRAALGKRFGYDELFVRLNNLTFSRKKFIVLMEDIVEAWQSVRELYLLKSGTNERRQNRRHAGDEPDTDTSSSSTSSSRSAETETRRDKRRRRRDGRDDDTATRQHDGGDGGDDDDDDGEECDDCVTSSAEQSNFIPNINLESTIAGTGGYIVSLVQQLCEYIGTRNIYIELYPALFTNLYLPSVDDNRLEHVLEKNFDPCMDSLHNSVSDAFCSELIMKVMFRKLVRALFTIVMDGGPERCRFKPTDAPLILKDIEAIETLFYADGSGIKSLPYIRKYTLRLRTIVSTVMDKSTPQILNGSEVNDPFDMLPERKPLFPDSPWTKQIVFRVLYHRIQVDPMARKWFEKHKVRYDW